MKLLILLQWTIVAAMFIAAAVAWPFVPETIAVHWSLKGQADGYANKLIGLLVIPLVATLVLLGLELLPRIDPRRANYASFRSAYAIAKLAIVAFFAAVDAVLLASALGRLVNVSLVIAPLVGALLIVLGAIMGQLQPNWFIGVRTPWTLSSDRSWIATHRAARWVFVAMGLAIVLAGLEQTSWSLYLAVTVCLLGIIGLVAYSFVVWREDPQHR